MKHMTQMPATNRTPDFNPPHPVARILYKPDIFPVCDVIKTWPSRITVKLRIGIKKFGTALRARVVTLLVVVQQRATERSFGVAIEHDPFLVVRQFPLLHTIKYTLKNARTSQSCRAFYGFICELLFSHKVWADKNHHP